MDRSVPIPYIREMIRRSRQIATPSSTSTDFPGAPSPSAGRRASLAELGGWRMLLHNPGLVIQTMRHGISAGDDAMGNRYFEENQVTRASGRKRRWVVYAGRRREASLVPPEWHAWLHYTTDLPIAAAVMPWQKAYLPNLTGTPAAYRPPGHDYESGTKRRRHGEYEAWTPDS